MGKLLDGLGVHLPSLILYTLNFLALWGVLHFLAFRPFLHLLRERREREEALAQAEARQAALLQEAQALKEQALAQGREEYATMLREAEALAQRYAQEARTRSNAEALAYLAKAREHASAELSQAQQELQTAFVELTTAVSRRALERGLREEDHRALISDALRELEEAAWSPPPLAPRGHAKVTSAVPLETAEQERLALLLERALGRRPWMHYQQDPSVLGGLAIRAGDSLLDATIDGRLQRLRKRLTP